MAKHNELGKEGESLAQEFLKDKGYTILETNWRYQRAEIDLIAMQGAILVFIEVKTRSNNYLGHPAEFVTPTKEQLIADAASFYMEQINHDWEIRFDIISILISPYGFQIEHLEDAFFPGLH